MKPSCVSGLSPVQQTHADDPHHDARSLRGDGRHGARRRQPLGAPPRRGAGEGAGPRARAAPAPRAGHRPACGPTTPSTRRCRSCTRRRTSPGGPSTCPNAVVLRGDTVAPRSGRRHHRRRRASSRSSPAGRSPTRTSLAARDALALYGGELLPEDRYEEWAEERREQLRLRHLDLLRLDGRWETVVELDPSDEVAHLALMRRHAAERRSPRRAPPVRAHGPALRARARRRARAARRSRCATACSPSTTSVAAPSRPTPS